MWWSGGGNYSNSNEMPFDTGDWCSNVSSNTAPAKACMCCRHNAGIPQCRHRLARRLTRNFLNLSCGKLNDTATSRDDLALMSARMSVSSSWNAGLTSRLWNSKNLMKDTVLVVKNNTMHGGKIVSSEVMAAKVYVITVWYCQSDQNVNLQFKFKYL